jgi:hypothetical protein
VRHFETIARECKHFVLAKSKYRSSTSKNHSATFDASGFESVLGTHVEQKDL